MLSHSLGFQQEDQPMYREQKEGWCSSAGTGLERALGTPSALQDTHTPWVLHRELALSPGLP